MRVWLWRRGARSPCCQHRRPGCSRAARGGGRSSTRPGSRGRTCWTAPTRPGGRSRRFRWGAGGSCCIPAPPGTASPGARRGRGRRCCESARRRWIWAGAEHPARLPLGSASGKRGATFPGGNTMQVTPAVKTILDNYESDNPGTKANLARILMQGKLGGTGKLVILPVDQGFEHGPGRSFAINPAAYDPHYHYQMAIDAGLNAYAAPLGALEAGADTFAGQIPTILKINSSNSWSTTKDQAVTGGVDDALRLGCAAIGFTIYPGCDDIFEMM